jgi:hypothetical protein
MIIVDTDILIDFTRGSPESEQFLVQTAANDELAVTAITCMELLVGARNKVELSALDRFLERFQVIQLTASISERAINLIRQYSLSHGLAIPDALNAATALTFDAAFATRNRRDYQFINGLKLQRYP